MPRPQLLLLLHRLCVLLRVDAARVRVRQRMRGAEDDADGKLREDAPHARELHCRELVLAQHPTLLWRLWRRLLRHARGSRRWRRRGGAWWSIVVATVSCCASTSKLAIFAANAASGRARHKTAATAACTTPTCTTAACRRRGLLVQIALMLVLVVPFALDLCADRAAVPAARWRAKRRR